MEKTNCGMQSLSCEEAVSDEEIQNEEVVGARNRGNGRSQNDYKEGKRAIEEGTWQAGQEKREAFPKDHEERRRKPRRSS
jgi:hypothetical protein